MTDIDKKLLDELDWCIENGHSGPRTHKLLLALRDALSPQKRALDYYARLVENPAKEPQ